MKKIYSYTYLYFAVFICLHYNIFAKTTDNPPVILKPTPVKALPVRFKPLPFRPLYLNKVDLYQFDQKAYVFGKITSAFPVLTTQEWQTVSNDPVRFTLTTDKPNAYVGEEIELTLTAELLNISPSTLFTFEELRSYTLKVVLPNNFIQNGGTYYDFVSDKLDAANPKKTYTIKGRYLAKPALDDCFKVLRKLNNEVFVLKDTQCPTITEVDIASIKSEEKLPEKTREITAIDLSKIKISSLLSSDANGSDPINENASTIYLNCYNWSNYLVISGLNYEGFQQIKANNGAVHWTVSLSPNGSNFSICQIPSINGDINGISSYILPNTTQITYTAKIYSTASCTGTLLTTLTKTYTINQTSPCPVPPASFTITASATTICSGNSSTLEASNICPSANIFWQKNNVTFNGGRTIAVSDAGTYKAVCSNPAATSNTIAISVSTIPPAPTVSANKNTLTPGEFAQLTGSNCSGTILWTGPNNFADVGNQISVNKAGAYNAKCQTTCNNTYYYSDLSATINISVAPLRIEANKPQVASGESVTLTAYGCTNGYIKWKVNDNLQPTTDNPFTFNSGGFYSASCNSWDGTYTSDWVTLFIHQTAANTPTVTADKLRAYNNDNVILTASGCSTYYWVIPVRQPNGTYVTTTPYPTGNPKTVTGPANYQVGCTNQGPWASVTVYLLQPGDITITSNKTLANPGEAVELTITGDCPNTAGIQWRIAGEYNWTNRYDAKTVYGPGTYEARCIIDDFSYGNWAAVRINTPAPGGITISASKTSAGSSELVTLQANGCTGEVVWTLPDNTEVRGSDLLYATGPGTYKAKCVRFGINGDPATIVIQTKPNDAPRFYATQSVASSNQIFQLVAENCPNNTVQWGVPKQDANGNTYYDYANFYQTLIVRGPGTYQVRCTGGNYTSFQDITVFPGASDALVIVADRAKALPSEYVKLVAYGCPNGTIKWEIGTQTATGAQITTQGPGNYKARCVGDPTNNGNYAIASILPNGSIVPIVVASIYVACPTDAVTLTAYSTTATNGCPAGWPMQWQYVKDDKIDYWLNNRNAIENFGENYTDVFETVSGSQIVRNGPRIYYARCLKPDGSWIGEFKDKSVTVEPVFPEYLRASNNGPALMGATGIRVAVTEVPAGGITYAWTGPNGFTSTLRNPEITGLTEAKSGIYTVTVKRGNICSVTATTNLVVSGCSDIKIKATDPTNGNETFSLPIVVNQVNQYGSLALAPIYYDGSSIPNSAFIWTKPDGTTSTGEYLITNTPGIYKVKVTPNGSTAGCTSLSYIIKENFHTELWEKAQNLNFQDDTAVTVIPLAHKSVEKTPFEYNLNIKDNPRLKNYVVPELLRYSLPDGTKHSEVLYILPTLYYLKHNNYIINGNEFSGYVMAFSENEQQYLGGWYYHHGNPVFRVPFLDYSMGGPQPKCYNLVLYDKQKDKVVDTGKTQVDFDPDKYDFIYKYPVDCNSQSSGNPGGQNTSGTDSEDNDELPPIPPVPGYPNCPGCGVPGWEWNKPRGGGGGTIDNNYSPFTPNILKSEHEFNNTALIQFTDAITRILSEVGNRLPQYYEFNPDAQIGVSEFNLLLNLIRSSLVAKFPNDANNINFTNIGNALASFKDKKYNDAAVQLLMGFGALNASGTTIRDQILSDVEIIVTTFYSLLRIETSFDIATGRNVANLILPAIENDALYEYDNSIYANENTINDIWNLLSGGQPFPTIEPKSYTRSDGLTITIIPASDFVEGKLIIKKGDLTTEIKAFSEESSSATPPALTRDQLKNNPNYSQLTTNLLRQLVTQNLAPEKTWHRDVIAGNALELAYRDFKGIVRNGKNFKTTVRTKKVRPDFVEWVGWIKPPSIVPFHFLNGKITEVKVTQNTISKESFNKQIIGYLDVLSKQIAVEKVKPPPFALILLLVVTEGTQIDNNLIEAANELKISLFVSYAFLKASDEKVTFSLPESLNNAPGVRQMFFPFNEVSIPWEEADRTWLQSNEYDESEKE